jgi:antitoxin component YwqK of YwqJK toxin-antitoxin module
LSYSGDWEEDAKVRGVIIYRNGDKYEGELYKDKRHGIGENRYQNGNIYKGSYANDKKNGIGLQWYPNGTLNQGTNKDGKRFGIQTMHFTATGDKLDTEIQD